jgi:hypothetical protein
MDHHTIDWNLYSPLATAEKWRTIALASKQLLGRMKVDDWIKGNLWRVESFASAENMWKLIDSLPDALGPHPWTCQSPMMMDAEREMKDSVYYQNPLDCIRLLLRCLLFKKDHVWSLVKKVADAEHTNRIYSNMHITINWCSKQEKLQKGATLVPVICGSDKTLLTTMTGNQSAWPVYLIIGNIPKHVQKKLSAIAVLLLAFLPMFPKGNNAASTRAGFNKALTIVFEPSQRVFSMGLNLDYAAGFVRYCFPRLAA